MATAKELKEEFDKLTDEEKTAFMKSVMPSFCQGFGMNPEKMMPFCKEVMKSFDMDMPGMMRMMRMMSMVGTAGAKKA